MKQYKLFLLSGILAILFGSCNDLLDLEPKDVILEENAFTKDSDFSELLNSTYTVIGSGKFLGGRYQIYSEFMSDNIDGTLLDGDWKTIYDRKSSIFEGIISESYKEPYIAVYRANVILENLDKVTSNDEAKKFEGEALFLRAIAHFNVVRVFAQPYGFTPDNSHLGVPLKLVSKPEAVRRATVKEVYEQVIKDLEKAEQSLPEENNGYPTKWSAKGLLAQVYFQMNDFANAYTYANEVIEQSGIAFNTNTEEYKSRFSSDVTTEAEFAIISKTADNEGKDKYINRGEEFNGQYRSDTKVPTLKFTKRAYDRGSTDKNDNRESWYILKDNFKSITKFNSDNLSVPLITITELKLIRAESAAEEDKNLDVAKQDLEDILTRAYKTPPTTPSVAAEIISTARKERILEFVGEGHIGQDLKRIGAKGENVIVRDAPWFCPGSVIQFPIDEIANNPGFIKNEEGGC